MSEERTYIVETKNAGKLVGRKVFKDTSLNYTNANKFAKEQNSKGYEVDLIAVESGGIERVYATYIV